MKRIGQVDAGIAVRQRLPNHVPILDGDVAQPQQASKHARHLLGREAAAATHARFEFEDDCLAGPVLLTFGDWPDSIKRRAAERCRSASGSVASWT
jgi:hypothetical protein